MTARVIRAPAGPPELANPMEYADPKCQYFTETEEGTDRWGRERKGLTACGSGRGEGEFVCRLWEEQSCRGCRNPGDRAFPCDGFGCTRDCGVCGGLDEASATMAYCGQEKSKVFHDGIFAEFGGSLRTDRYVAPPAEAAPDFPCAYTPVVEWGGRKWIETLRTHATGRWTAPEHWPKDVGYPMLATTMKTVFPGRGRPGGVGRRARAPRRSTSLRDRLGGFQGPIMVNGLTKDNLLDDVWEDRERVWRWCRDQGVDYMVTPQYSAYPTAQNAMMIYNANRIFTWYERCMEMGFKHVALDVPPNFHARWVLDEFFGFAERSKCKLFALSYQQFKARGGLDYRTAWNAKLVNECMPKDAGVIIFGPGTIERLVACSKIFAGRPIMFSSVEPYARSAFYQLLPFGASAPAGMEKVEVFCRNLAMIESMSMKAISKVANPSDTPAKPGKRRGKRGKPRGKAKSGQGGMFAR